MTLIITAIDFSSNNKGIIKDIAKTNFVSSVASVDSHTALFEYLFSDSSDMCMPNASDIESEIAIINIPSISIMTESETEFSPTISPSVVIIPEVNPKLNPFLNERLIFMLSY